jgi:hypothetical protein
MKRKNTFRLDHSTIQSRLGLCAAALAGTAAAVPSADGAIITFTTPYTLPNPFSGVVPATSAGVYINLGTGATGSSAGAVTGWDFNPYLAGGGTQLGFYWDANAGGVAATNATGPYLSLTPGTVISGASTFTRVILGTTGSPYLTTGTEILGFQFLNEATGVVDFGYMTIDTNATTGFPTTISSWSYDNTGAAITVVPEPATTALLSIGALALGALGLRQWRRRAA